ncbi:MAG: ATPase [Gammaproteobacteria bacterium]|nr:MAG: ATPase [Gammaproteobacteria bacterium]
MSDIRDLEILLASQVPIIVVETFEERRVAALFQSLGQRVRRPLFKWAVTEGLLRLADGFTPQMHAREPTELLAQIRATKDPGIYLLADFHPYLDDPVHVRLLKDIALGFQELGHTVVLISHALKVPAEIERYCARFKLSLPGAEQIRHIVLSEAQEWSRRNKGQNVRTNRKMLDRLTENLRGLPEADVRRLARGAIEDDGAITEEDLPAVMRTKFQLLGKDGILSYEYDTARFADVGGLAQLKKWLKIREDVFSGALTIPGLDPPKGILLLGVQGCGKSLAAKAVSGSWGVPLLRLDFGTLYNKYHGETERNLRESLTQAEVMEPCVLWIDEIERGVATDGGDSGTSRRLLGTLLTWMAENQKRVFIVATANEIDALPPELMRKGRLDEIFFVDLPDAETRNAVLNIHLKKRGLDPTQFDIEALTAACDGFSGSEIEQAIVSTLYTCHARQKTVNTEYLLEEIAGTRALSIVMAERIAALRAWATDRTVPAN